MTAAFGYILYFTGYQSTQFVRRALHYASGSRKFLCQSAQSLWWSVSIRSYLSIYLSIRWGCYFTFFEQWSASSLRRTIDIQWFYFVSCKKSCINLHKYKYTYKHMHKMAWKIMRCWAKIRSWVLWPSLTRCFTIWFRTAIIKVYWMKQHGIKRTLSTLS